MDGRTLIDTVIDALDKPVADELFDTDHRVLYGYLDAAAAEFVRATRCLTGSATITTVASQQAYDLPPDFINLYMRNAADRHFVRYYDGTGYHFPVLTTYEALFRANETAERACPARFCITDRTTPPAIISSTTTAAGAQSAGQCTLTDSTKLFTTTNLVYPRDIVHNATDASDGVVLTVTDATRLVTALFSGKKNAWGNGDAYVIQRASGKQILLDAPSESSGHTITVPYVCMPSPVFSDYGFWRFPPMSCRAIAFEAAFLYQNRKGNYPGADRHHVLFLNEVNRIRTETARAALRGGRYKQTY